MKVVRPDVARSIAARISSPVGPLRELLLAGVLCNDAGLAGQDGT